VSGSEPAIAPQPRIVMIAAHDRQRAIGRDGQLPWHLPDDLKRFKALTLNKSLLMGRKTAESLGRALPKRRNLVLTRSGRVPFAGMDAVASLEHASALCEGELCVIGGGEVYALCLRHAQALHLTYVDATVDAPDAFFPVILPEQWQETGRSVHVRDENHEFSFAFVDFVRITDAISFGDR
jgi:dihydrofolate reductase